MNYSTDNFPDVGTKVTHSNSPEYGVGTVVQIDGWNNEVRVEWSDYSTSRSLRHSPRYLVPVEPIINDERAVPIIQDEKAVTIASLESRKSAKQNEINKHREKITGLETQAKNLRESIERKMVEKANIDQQIAHLTNL